MKWIYEAEKVRPSAKMQYILGNMYYEMGNTDAGNHYLNKSCQHKEMAKMCEQYNTLKKDVNSGTCPKL